MLQKQGKRQCNAAPAPPWLLHFPFTAWTFTSHYWSHNASDTIDMPMEMTPLTLHGRRKAYSFFHFLFQFLFYVLPHHCHHYCPWHGEKECLKPTVQKAPTPPGCHQSHFLESQKIQKLSRKVWPAHFWMLKLTNIFLLILSLLFAFLWQFYQAKKGRATMPPSESYAHSGFFFPLLFAFSLTILSGKERKACNATFWKLHTFWLLFHLCLLLFDNSRKEGPPCHLLEAPHIQLLFHFFLVVFDDLYQAKKAMLAMPPSRSLHVPAPLFTSFCFSLTNFIRQRKDGPQLHLRAAPNIPASFLLFSAFLWQFLSGKERKAHNATFWKLCTFQLLFSLLFAFLTVFIRQRKKERPTMPSFESSMWSSFCFHFFAFFDNFYQVQKGRPTMLASRHSRSSGHSRRSSNSINNYSLAFQEKLLFLVLRFLYFFLIFSFQFLSIFITQQNLLVLTLFSLLFTLCQFLSIFLPRSSGHPKAPEAQFD